MNVVDRHLKIMESYVRNPKIHTAAITTPSMQGGPFIDYNGEGLAEISALIEETKSKQSQMIALSNAIKEFDQLLRTGANGFSLDEIYTKVPDLLRGCV